MTLRCKEFGMSLYYRYPWAGCIEVFHRYNLFQACNIQYHYNSDRVDTSSCEERYSLYFFILFCNKCWPQNFLWISTYRKTTNISRTLLGNQIVDHWHVVGASPVGAAPTATSLSTQHLTPTYCTKTTAWRSEKHLIFGIWCVLFKIFI